MAARTRKRRRIVIEGELFLWSAHEGDVGFLHVVAADKRLNLRYGWQHWRLPDGERYVDVMGPRFAGLPPGRHGWLRVQAPTWSDENPITPGFVRKLVLWALQPKPHVAYKVLPGGVIPDGMQSFSASPGDRLEHAGAPVARGGAHGHPGRPAR